MRLTVLDAANNGWHTKHTIDFSMGIIGTFVAPVGIVWFGANLINMAITGKTISESIQDRIDNEITFE